MVSSSSLLEESTSEVWSTQSLLLLTGVPLESSFAFSPDFEDRGVTGNGGFLAKLDTILARGVCWGVLIALSLPFIEFLADDWSIK